MSKNHHISSYRSLIWVLITLLICTILTIAITSIHLGAFTVTVALLIACIKIFIVVTYFMHVKFESRLIKVMVSGVLFLFLIIVTITFIDYAYRPY